MALIREIFPSQRTLPTDLVLISFHPHVAIVLDKRIDQFGDLLQRTFQLVDDWSDPAETSDVSARLLLDLLDLTRPRLLAFADVWSPTPVALQQASYVIGQIHTDSTGKLNETSVYLQASRSIGAGSRTPLRFATKVLVRGGAPGVSGAGLFRGAILGFKGRNGGTGFFLVEEIMIVSSAWARETEDDQTSGSLVADPVSSCPSSHQHRITRSRTRRS